MKPFYATKSDFPSDLLLKMRNHFLNEIPWESDTYIIQGKKVTPSRKTFMYGPDYIYSGNKKTGHSFTPQIEYIAKHVALKLGLPSDYFNACLLNLYPDGNSSLSYHKDDEKEMEEGSIIASFSLGETRKFYLKNDETKLVEKLLPEEGDILVMEALCQKEWTHSIPKETKKQKPRISLTFRRFIK